MTSEKAARDPRHDPQVGDVLVSNNITFKVIRRQARRVWAEADGERQKTGLKLHQWRRFLRDAEVARAGVGR